LSPIPRSRASRARPRSLVTPARVLPSQPHDQLARLSAIAGRPGQLCGECERSRAMSRCQSSRLAGLTTKRWRRSGTKRRANAARNARSAQSSRGLGAGAAPRAHAEEHDLCLAVEAAATS
jgi:hypothetical protein